MAATTEELLQMILQSLEKVEYIKSEDIPNIDLYMDQVLTFMDRKLRSAVRPQTEDRILTKTMINNYAKNDLLPPPVKKKYTKEHVLTLIFIYYFKNILSISDLQRILNPITEKHFASDSDLGLEDIYSEVFSLEHDEVSHLAKDITRIFNVSFDTFADAPEDEKEFLHTFSFICMLSFDVFVKKMMIEKIIDELPKNDPREKEKAEKKEKKQKRTE